MPLSFDTTGLQPAAEDSWIDPNTGDMAAIRYFDLPPDLPAPLEAPCPATVPTTSNGMPISPIIR